VIPPAPPMPTHSNKQPDQKRKQEPQQELQSLLLEEIAAFSIKNLKHVSGKNEVGNGYCMVLK